MDHPRSRLTLRAGDRFLAVEQEAVDHAYDCYTARLAEMSGTSAATASASGKDGIANRVEAEARAAAYGGLGGESSSSLASTRRKNPERHLGPGTSGAAASGHGHRAGVLRGVTTLPRVPEGPEGGGVRSPAPA
ncbi:hypothetical protein AB0L47_07730 [Streptomyces bobili]|uniref:hypothetical protein n=1 Tax=Streptomyces bobili TaxID=67280 RepID=UPI0034210EFC